MSDDSPAYLLESLTEGNFRELRLILMASLEPKVADMISAAPDISRSLRNAVVN